MGRMDDSEVRGEGAGILSGSGVFEVTLYDGRRLPPECCLLRGARRAWLLCINISPLILVTSCLVHPEQAGRHDPATVPVSEAAKWMLQQEGSGSRPMRTELGPPAGCWSPGPAWTCSVTSGPSLFLPEPLFPCL